MIQDLRIKEKGIFEKVVRREDGRFFRVQFIVFEANGKLRGKIVSCEEILYLPVFEKANLVKAEKEKVCEESKSPYFNICDFLKAQPIRGPSFAV